MCCNIHKHWCVWWDCSSEEFVNATSFVLFSYGLFAVLCSVFLLYIKCCQCLFAVCTLPHCWRCLWSFVGRVILHVWGAMCCIGVKHGQWKEKTKQAIGGRLPQYASAPCKLTISAYLFARWRYCSGITISSYLFASWHLFRHVGYLRHQQQVDLWPFWPWNWCLSHMWRGLPLCQF